MYIKYKKIKLLVIFSLSIMTLTCKPSNGNINEIDKNNNNTIDIIDKLQIDNDKLNDKILKLKEEIKNKDVIMEQNNSKYNGIWVSIDYKNKKYLLINIYEKRAFVIDYNYDSIDNKLNKNIFIGLKKDECIEFPTCMFPFRLDVISTNKLKIDDYDEILLMSMTLSRPIVDEDGGIITFKGTDNVDYSFYRRINENDINIMNNVLSK